MAKLKHILGISTSLMLITTPVFAGGLYLTELGTPISVGTAGVGNVTNTISPDSVFTNPAGMIGIEGDQFLAGSQVVLPSIRFDSDSASTAGGSDGGNAGFVSAIPSAFYVKTLDENWRLGVGFTAQLGGGVDYGKDFVGRYHAQRSVLGGYGISPAVAYRVNSKLSLGAGVSCIYSELDLDIALNQPLGLSDGQVQLDALDDWGYQGFFGLMYEATNRLTIGAVYRSETDADLEGDVHFKNILIPLLNDLTSNLNDAELNFTYPQMVNLGMKYKLTEDTLLMADFDWEEWSAFGDTRIGISDGASPVITTFDRHWDDTWHVGFALAHRLAADQVITGGIGYDSSPVSDSNRTADLAADEQLRFSAAYGKEISDQMNFSLGGTFLWLGEGKMDQVVQGERYKGEFSTNHIIFLSASLKYKF